MRGICPKSVIKKNTKADLGPKIRRSIQERANSLKQEIINDSYLRNFLNLDHVKQIETANNKSKLNISNLYKWYVLDKWIKSKKY